MAEVPVAETGFFDEVEETRDCAMDENSFISGRRYFAGNPSKGISQGPRVFSAPLRCNQKSSPVEALALENDA